MEKIKTILEKEQKEGKGNQERIKIKTNPKKLKNRDEVEVIKKARKLKRVKVDIPSVPRYDVSDIRGKLNLMQFRARIVMLSREDVVKDFIFLINNNKLVNARSCFLELKRIGFGSLLATNGIDLK